MKYPTGFSSSTAYFITDSEEPIFYIENDLLYILAVIAVSIAVVAVLHWLSAQIIKLYFKITDKFSGKVVETLQ
ncbi:MAG: hypothetical protein LUG95_00910 [Clostridiales bacterium]|nr:hypothetical protein [Clostridiales bacterium]